jgi:hypothetical protein
MATDELIDTHPLSANCSIYFVKEGGFAVLDEEGCCYLWYWDVPQDAGGAEIGSAIPEGWGTTPFNDLAKAEWGRWLEGSRL